MNAIKEYQRIVEFGFQAKKSHFVIRFLDGTSYVLAIDDLPKKLQTRKPDWSSACLSEDHSSILVQVGKEVREIPSHVVHSRGRLV